MLVIKNKLSRAFLFYQGPAIFWAMLIFVLSSLPDIPGPRLGVEFEDKWGHVVVYTILGILLARAFFQQRRFPSCRRNYILIAIIIGIVYGISDEYHQSFVPGRFADVVDALADTLGIIIGVLLFRFVPFFYRN